MIPCPNPTCDAAIAPFPPFACPKCDTALASTLEAAPEPPPTSARLDQVARTAKPSPTVASAIQKAILLQADAALISSALDRVRTDAAVNALEEVHMELGMSALHAIGDALKLGCPDADEIELDDAAHDLSNLPGGELLRREIMSSIEELKESAASAEPTAPRTAELA